VWYWALECRRYERKCLWFRTRSEWSRKICQDRRRLQPPLFSRSDSNPPIFSESCWSLLVYQCFEPWSSSHRPFERRPTFESLVLRLKSRVDWRTSNFPCASNCTKGRFDGSGNRKIVDPGQRIGWEERIWEDYSQYNTQLCYALVHGKRVANLPYSINYENELGLPRVLMITEHQVGIVQKGEKHFFVFVFFEVFWNTFEHLVLDV